MPFLLICQNCWLVAKSREQFWLNNWLLFRKGLQIFACFLGFGLRWYGVFWVFGKIKISGKLDRKLETKYSFSNINIASSTSLLLFQTKTLVDVFQFLTTFEENCQKCLNLFSKTINTFFYAVFYSIHLLDLAESRAVVWASYLSVGFATKKGNREKLRIRRKCCSKSVGCEENEKSCKKWGIIEKKWKNVRGNGKMEKLRCVCKLVFISFANSIADCLSRIFSLEDLPMKLLEMMILNFFFLISR